MKAKMRARMGNRPGQKMRLSRDHGLCSEWQLLVKDLGQFACFVK
jgi:hypothetical protein